MPYLEVTPEQFGTEEDHHQVMLNNTTYALRFKGALVAQSLRFGNPADSDYSGVPGVDAYRSIFKTPQGLFVCRQEIHFTAEEQVFYRGGVVQTYEEAKAFFGNLPYGFVEAPEPAEEASEDDEVIYPGS